MPDGTNVVTLNYPTSEELANIDIYGWDRANPNAQFKIPIGAGGVLSGEGAPSGGGGGSTPAVASAQTWDFNFTDAAVAYIRAQAAMTITQQATSGTGTVAYEKSTAAAPDTFASASSPITLEGGAKLKVTASAVDESFAVHLERTG